MGVERCIHRSLNVAKLMLLTSIFKRRGGEDPPIGGEVQSPLVKIALYPCLHLYAVSWLSSLHCRLYTVYVRVGSVAVEHSTVAPGRLRENPKCLSILFETSSYPQKKISGAATSDMSPTCENNYSWCTYQCRHSHKAYADPPPSHTVPVFTACSYLIFR